VGFRAGHVESHLAQNGLGHHHVDTGEIHSGDALHFAAEIEPRGILGWLGLLARRRHLRSSGQSVVGQLGQMLLQLTAPKAQSNAFIEPAMLLQNPAEGLHQGLLFLGFLGFLGAQL